MSAILNPNSLHTHCALPFFLVMSLYFHFHLSHFFLPSPHIFSLSIRLHLFVSLQIIANHHMQSISFASGGDPVSHTSFTLVFFLSCPSFSPASYFSPSLPVLCSCPVLRFELIPPGSRVVSLPLVMTSFSCDSKLTFLTFF